MQNYFCKDHFRIGITYKWSVSTLGNWELNGTTEWGGGGGLGVWQEVNCFVRIVNCLQNPDPDG